MWASQTTASTWGPCSCTTTGCTCSDGNRGPYEITIPISSADLFFEDKPPPKKGPPIPPWLAKPPFGGKQRKKQRGPEFSAPRALRLHRSQSR